MITPYHFFFFNWKIIALQNVAVFCHINTKHFNIRILELSQHWKCYGERLSCSVVFISLRPRGLYPARLLRPWNFPGENTRVGSHSLLQGIFPTQGSSPGLLHCRQILYCLSHQGSISISKSQRSHSISLSYIFLFQALDWHWDTGDIILWPSLCPQDYRVRGTSAWTQVGTRRS